MNLEELRKMGSCLIDKYYKKLVLSYHLSMSQRQKPICDDFSRTSFFLHILLKNFKIIKFNDCGKEFKKSYECGNKVSSIS